SGKSTLCNLLLDQPHDKGPFTVSEGMNSCTQICAESEFIIDGQSFNIVDTPGFFDTSKPDEEVFREIAKTVQKCAYGVKAILFVLEAKRFTTEQKNVLNSIKTFLGESALDYMIAVFSHATKNQNADKDEMRKAWSSEVTSFVGSIGNRWGISPNSDYFPSEDEKHQSRLREIKDFILSTSGFYTSERFESVRQEQEKIMREMQEKERLVKEEYEERLRREGKERADSAYQEEVNRMRTEYEQRQKDSLDAMANDMKIRFDEMATESRNLSNKIAQLESEKGQLESNANDMRIRFDAMTIESHNLSSKVTQLESEKGQLESNRNDMRIRFDEMTTESHNLSSKVTQLESEKGQLESNRNDMESIRGSLENEINELKRQLRERSQSCFALDTKVQLASGELVEMAELQIGDLVLSGIKNNQYEFSEIYLISHLGHFDNPFYMIKIKFTNPDGSQGYIRMTPTHCVLNSDLSLLYALDVVPGETKILVLNRSNEFIPVIVDSLDIEKETGYISFYTRSSTVIANNILCSCYDDCPKSQFLMDLVFAPIRLWTKVFPSNYRQKELHPYVQTLETVYAILCRAVNVLRQLSESTNFDSYKLKRKQQKAMQRAHADYRHHKQE
ncbi:17859_t:CDS:2, partial [Cetraspora pellucida]